MKVKEIKGSKVEFSKLSNRSLSKAYRLYMGAMAKVAGSTEAESQAAILESFSHENYEKISEILFSGILIDGKDFLKCYEEILDAKDFSFELELYNECIMHYLGKSLGAAGEDKSGEAPIEAN